MYPSLKLAFLYTTRSALDKKKAEVKKEYGAIDYDEPVESERSTIGPGTKVLTLQ